MLNRYEYSIRGSLLFNIDFISRPLNFVFFYLFIYFFLLTQPQFSQQCHPNVHTKKINVNPCVYYYCYCYYYFLLCTLADLIPLNLLRKRVITHDQSPLRVHLLSHVTPKLSLKSLLFNFQQRSFLNNEILILLSNFSSHLSKFFVTLSNDPTTIGITCTVLMSHILAVSLLSS